jgi:hypothetical protein
MLKHENISVSISYRNIGHFRKLGYSPIIGENLEIKTTHLSSSSHVKIIAICDFCSNEQELIYCKYMENVKRHGFYGCKKCSRQKATLTSIDRYGVDNYSKTNEYKKRVELTCLEKYGYKTNLINPEHIENNKRILLEKYNTEKFFEINRKKSMRTRKYFKLKENIIDYINSDIYYSEDDYDLSYISEKYLTYRNECRKLTKRNIESLYESWDGYDFYDNSYIFDNFNLEHNDPNYPTIDHKISVYYGYLNGIDPSEISKISNLCFTKRSINSKKRDENFDKFKIKFRSKI